MALRHQPLPTLAEPRVRLGVRELLRRRGRKQRAPSTGGGGERPGQGARASAGPPVEQWCGCTELVATLTNRCLGERAQPRGRERERDRERE